MKPGFKTSEFWLSVLVTVMGILLASGVLSDGGKIASLIGGLMAILPAPAYSFGRAKEKSVKAIADAQVEAALASVPEQPEDPSDR